MQPDLVVSTLPVASLVPYAENARTHSEAQVAQIAASIAEFGFVNPVLVDADGVPRAYAGWRVLEFLASGRHVYVDDLVTDATARSQGLGAALLDWLKAEARRLGCTRLQLDSGTQRKDAHAFYLREGLRIEGFHFGIALD